MSSLMFGESSYRPGSPGPDYLVGNLDTESALHTAQHSAVKHDSLHGVEAIADDQAARLGRRDRQRKQEQFNTRMDRLIVGGLAVALGALSFHLFNVPSPGRVIDRAVQVDQRFHTYTPSPADLKYKQLQERINRGH